MQVACVQYMNMYKVCKVICIHHLQGGYLNVQQADVMHNAFIYYHAWNQSSIGRNCFVLENIF